MTIFNSQKDTKKAQPGSIKPDGWGQEATKELEEASLEDIAGGLNPQPIPPGRRATFAGESGTGKISIA